MTRIKYSSCSRALCRSSSSLKVWLYHLCFTIGEQDGGSINITLKMGISVRSAGLAPHGGQKQGTKRGATLTGKALAGDGKDSRVPRSLGRGFSLSVCGADLGAKRVIVRRNTAGKKLLPARDKHFEACDFCCGIN